ncbi:hypothetical protein BCF55_1482 [Hydrogenivirga caldilitoris]|uniref:Uncharacterized protein n=1 Tax=Hydrogenivirga caldilitoris TaxID=246264 RepID=A0A497XWN9_9AQUI|nr:hypothetical protein BCF55_1482 [Hydrogenivirga caldilitoris]
MSDVVALVLVVAFIHGILLIYWKGMAKARKGKYRKL